MKICVLGGAGYVGSFLVSELMQRGYDVDVIDDLWFGNPFLSMDGEKPFSLCRGKFNLIKKNLFNVTEKEMSQYDQAIFLAGMSNDPCANYRPDLNFIYNSALPSYLCYIAKTAGLKRFVYASSCSAYGYAQDKFFTEKDEINCSFPYGISKLQGERGCLQLADEKFSCICLRKGTISGHSFRPRFDLLVNTMFKNACLFGKITVNNPSIWRPLLDIRDAASAYLRAIQADSKISGAFNVASANLTIGGVADLVKEEFDKHGLGPIYIETNSSDDNRNYKVDCSSAECILGFKPSHTVRDIVSSLIQHRNKYGDFSNPFYYNIEIFKTLDKQLKV